jgi:hypothetical protein
MQRTPFPEKKWSKVSFTRIKKLSKGDYLKLLRKDPNWIETSGNVFVNKNLKPPYDVVTIHYHKAKDTFENPRFIKNILNQICWTEELLREWRVL